MTAICTMAGPVQHEINNMLMVVFSNLDFLKSTAVGGPPRQLDRIQQAIDRIDVSTRTLLNLMRRPVTDTPAALRLSDIIIAIQPVLGLLLTGSCALACEPAAKEPLVRLDRIALEDALLLLAQQASEVLPRGVGLAPAIAVLPNGVELSVRLSTALALPALPALDTLAELARAAGGSATIGPEGLSLTLPAETPPA